MSAAAAAVLVGATPAGATGTFEVNGLYDCTSIDTGHFYCYDWTGATGPYTSSTSTNTPTWVHVTETDVYASNAYVYGSCLRGHAYALTLSLHDATGATGSGTDTGICGS